MNLAEARKKQVELGIKLRAAKEEGDLRENSQFSSLLQDISSINRLVTELEKSEQEHSLLKLRWHPPKELHPDGVITMGVKVYHKEFDKPVVVFPVFVVAEKRDHPDYYATSTRTPFAIKYIGKRVSDLPEVDRIEVI